MDKTAEIPISCARKSNTIEKYNLFKKPQTRTWHPFKIKKVLNIKLILSKTRYISYSTLITHWKHLKPSMSTYYILSWLTPYSIKALPIKTTFHGSLLQRRQCFKWQCAISKKADLFGQDYFSVHSCVVIKSNTCSEACNRVVFVILWINVFCKTYIHPISVFTLSLMRAIQSRFSLLSCHFLNLNSLGHLLNANVTDINCTRVKTRAGLMINR